MESVPGVLKSLKIRALFQVAWGHSISSPPPPTVLRAHIFKEPRNQIQGINSSSLCGLRRCFYSFKDPRNRFQGIDSKELIPPAYVGWRAGTTTPVPSPPIDCSKTPEPVFVNVYGAQESIPRNRFRQPM